MADLDASRSALASPDPVRLGTLLVAGSALGWSTAGVFTRLVTADAFAIAGWRGIFSAVLVAAYLQWREPGGLVAALRGLGWGSWLVAGISTAATLSYIAALLFTSVANVVVIYATSPFLTAALGWLILREMPRRTTLLAATLALAGIAVMVGSGGAAGGALGVALAFATTFCMAMITVLTRRLRRISMIPSTCLSAVQLAAVGSLMTPMLQVSGHDIGVLILFAIVQAVAFSLYLEGARRLTSARASLLSTLDVPFAPLLVWLFIGEVPSGATVVGGLIVLAAVVWDVASTSRRATPAP